MKKILIPILTSYALTAIAQQNDFGHQVTNAICIQRSHFSDPFTADSEDRVKRKIFDLGFKLTKKTTSQINDFKNSIQTRCVSGQNRLGKSYTECKRNTSMELIHKTHFLNHLESMLQTQSNNTTSLKDTLYQGWCTGFDKHPNSNDIHKELISLSRQGEFANAFCYGQNIVEPHIYAPFTAGKSSAKCLGATCNGEYQNQESFFMNLGIDLSKIDLSDDHVKISLFGTASTLPYKGALEDTTDCAGPMNNTIQGYTNKNKCLALTRAKTIIGIINDNKSCLRESIKISSRIRKEYAFKDLQNYINSSDFINATSNDLKMNCPISSLVSDFDEAVTKANKYKSSKGEININKPTYPKHPADYHTLSCKANRLLDDYHKNSSNTQEGTSHSSRKYPLNDISTKGIAYMAKDENDNTIDGLSCGGDSTVKWSNTETELRQQRVSCLKLNLVMHKLHEYIKKYEVAYISYKKISSGASIAIMQKPNNSNKHYFNQEIGLKFCYSKGNQDCNEFENQLDFYLNINTSPLPAGTLSNIPSGLIPISKTNLVNDLNSLNENYSPNTHKHFANSISLFNSFRYSLPESIKEKISKEEKEKYINIVKNNKKYYSTLIKYHNCKNDTNLESTCQSIIDDFYKKYIANSVLAKDLDPKGNNLKSFFETSEYASLKLVYLPFQSVGLDTEKFPALAIPNYSDSSSGVRTIPINKTMYHIIKETLKKELPQDKCTMY